MTVDPEYDFGTWMVIHDLTGVEKLLVQQRQHRGWYSKLVRGGYLRRVKMTVYLPTDEGYAWYDHHTEETRIQSYANRPERDRL